MRIYTIIFANGERRHYQTQSHVTGREAFILIQDNGEHLRFPLSKLSGWQLVTTPADCEALPAIS